MLNQIASVTMDAGPAQIDRLDRSRQVTFDVELGSRQLGDVYAEAMQLPTMKTAARREARRTRRYADDGGTSPVSAWPRPLACLCIYAVLVLLFRDFLQPVTILAALPCPSAARSSSFSHRKELLDALADRAIGLDGYRDQELDPARRYAIVARRDHGLSRLEAIVDAYPNVRGRSS